MIDEQLMATVRVDEKIKDKLNEEAKKRGVTVNYLIKELLNLSDSISFFVDNNSKENEEPRELESSNRVINSKNHLTLERCGI